MESRGLANIAPTSFLSLFSIISKNGIPSFTQPYTNTVFEFFLFFPKIPLRGSANISPIPFMIFPHFSRQIL
jgi:hypothetical protein